MKLHSKQSVILKLLQDNVNHPLTMVELSREAEITSPGVLYHHLRQLEKKGYLRRNPDNPMDYVVNGSPEKEVTYINMFGLAQCGRDGFMLDDAPIDRMPIPTKILRFPTSEAFIVKASGDSMSPKIENGDILIVRKQTSWDFDDIVVCVNEGKTIVKKLVKVEDRFVLFSQNKMHAPFAPADDFRIIGVVKNIIQSQ